MIRSLTGRFPTELGLAGSFSPGLVYQQQHAPRPDVYVDDRTIYIPDSLSVADEFAAAALRPTSTSEEAVSQLLQSLSLFIVSADTNGDGVVTLREAVNFLKKCGIDPRGALALLEKYDVDRDGAITPWDDLHSDGVLNSLDLARVVPGDPNKRYVRRRPVHSELTVVKEVAKRRMREKLDFVRSSARMQHVAGTKRVIYHFDVPILDLPKQFVGTKILHISDVHFTIGDTASIREFAAMIGAMTEVPDVVVFTGDVVTESLADLSDDGLAAFAKIPGGRKLFTLGNHDYGRPVDRSAQILQKMSSVGFHNLTNTSMMIERDGARLHIHGLDDHLCSVITPPSIPFEYRGDPHILATHNLDALSRQIPGSIDLVLSGHLHSGEVNLLLLDGINYLKWVGAYRNLNKQRRGWKPLSWRTLSYISPSFGTRAIRFNTEAPGFTLHRLCAF